MVNGGPFLSEEPFINIIIGNNTVTRDPGTVSFALLAKGFTNGQGCLTKTLLSLFFSQKSPQCRGDFFDH